MCIRNSSFRLVQLRSETQPLQVWKLVSLPSLHAHDPTPYTGVSPETHTKWIEGQTVWADKILEPLENREESSSGLYFYLPGIYPIPERPRYGDQAIVIAEVNPKNIIGVEHYVIVATKAKVISIEPKKRHWDE